MTESQLMRYMFIANCTGHPGVSFPVGATKGRRLPIGLQLIGRPWSEGLLLKLAGAWEAGFGRVHPAAVPPPEGERAAGKKKHPAAAVRVGESLCACPLWAALADSAPPPS